MDTRLVGISSTIQFFRCSEVYRLVSLLTLVLFLQVLANFKQHIVRHGNQLEIRKFFHVTGLPCETCGPVIQLLKVETYPSH
jgi:hypothetical protein